jgi:hypothetical protein
MSSNPNYASRACVQQRMTSHVRHADVHDAKKGLPIIGQDHAQTKRKPVTHIVGQFALAS